MADGTGLMADGTGLMADGTGLMADGTGLMADGTGLMADGTGRTLVPRHPGGAVALAVLAVVIAVILGAVLFHGVRPVPAFPDRSGRPARGAAGPATGVAALDAVLDRRASALLRHDRAAWLAAVDPGAVLTRREQAAAFDRIRALAPVRWRYRVTRVLPAAPGTPGTPGTPGNETLRARVMLTYRLAGDTRDVRRGRAVTLTRHGVAWWLEAEVPATDVDRDLWDLAPLAVARSGRGVAVNLDGTPSGAAVLAGQVDAAARAVDTVWGPAWPRSVVVVLPAGTGQFAAVLGRGDAAGLDQLAAVTSGPLDRGRTGPHVVAGAADRVVLNPVLWGRLTEVGRRAVLTHELVHVATRATTSATPPTWLDEGFAAYVGYRGTGLADAEIAADALPAVRSGRVPAALPGDPAFDPARGDAGPAYAQAWVACDLIARRAGVGGLVAVYRAATRAGGGQAGVAAALRQVLGESTDAFTAQWRVRLRAIARSGG